MGCTYFNSSLFRLSLFFLSFSLSLSLSLSLTHSHLLSFFTSHFLKWAYTQISVHIFSKISEIISQPFNWLINFNVMSTRLGLFYAQKLGNCVHCTFIFTFFVDSKGYVIWFNGISTLNSYFLPNPVYIWFLVNSLLLTLLNEPKLICDHSLMVSSITIKYY